MFCLAAVTVVAADKKCTPICYLLEYSRSIISFEKWFLKIFKAGKRAAFEKL